MSWSCRDDEIHTFPLVVRKELEVGVEARVWLAWRQVVSVGLAGVGVLITAAGARVLLGKRETIKGLQKQIKGGGKKIDAN